MDKSVPRVTVWQTLVMPKQRHLGQIVNPYHKLMSDLYIMTTRVFQNNFVGGDVSDNSTFFVKI